jgi:hypothetical protein
MTNTICTLFLLKFNKIVLGRLHIQGVVEANQTACNGLPIYQVKKEIKKRIKMEIYNLLSCGIKYDIDDFESFLLKMILKVFLQNYFYL